MTSRLKTLHHFLEEYPADVPNKSWDDDDTSLEDIANRLNDEVQELTNSMENVKDMSQAEVFQILALMINKSRLYVSAMNSIAIAGLENTIGIPDIRERPY